MTPAQRSLAAAEYPKLRGLVARMLRVRRPARYLGDDLLGAAALGLCQAVARNAKNPLGRANGAVLDALRAELPLGYRRPRHGRDGMPVTLDLADIEEARV